MADVRTQVVAKPIWVDLSTSDLDGAQSFYKAVFGWQALPPDPNGGGYLLLRSGDDVVVGIGPKQSEQQPTAWAVYIGTDDADGAARKVEAAGGTVVAPPFDVLEAGRMAVFQDPAGGFFSVWQPKQMRGADALQQPNSLGWAELNSRDIDRAVPFYQEVFGWGVKRSPMGEGMGDYTEFQLDGDSIAGAMSMPSMVPAEVPSFWMVYFLVDDIDAAVERARGAGGQVQMGPAEYPGGRYSVLLDPQGAVFGLISS